MFLLVEMPNDGNCEKLSTPSSLMVYVPSVTLPKISVILNVLVFEFSSNSASAISGCPAKPGAILPADPEMPVCDMTSI